MIWLWGVWRVRDEVRMAAGVFTITPSESTAFKCVHDSSSPSYFRVETMWR